MRSCELRYPSGSAGGVSFCAEARGGDISLSGATRFCQQRHRCGPSGRRIQNYVGCKALPLYGAREESFRAGRRSGSGDRGAGDPVRNLFAPQLQLDEREIQKPSVFGGVLFHISFAVERNMAADGIEKKVVGPLRPKVTRARERGIFPPEGAIQAPPVADTAR